MIYRQTAGTIAALLFMLPITPVLDASEQEAPPPSSTPAPETETKETFRGEVTVSDTPILESNAVDDYGSLVGAVTARQIDDLNAQDLSAALRRVPGVVVSRYNLVGTFGGGDGGAIFIRGHGSGRPGSEIAILSDGVPRFVGVWAHPLLDPLTLDTVDRVDIYRGAQPVLFGAMAFGAVNMVSKRRLEAGFEGRFVGSFGEFDTRVGRLEAGGREGGVDWFVTASHRSSDGHRNNADGEVRAYSGRLGFSPGESWDFNVRYEFTEGDVGDPGAEGATPPTINPRYVTDSSFAVAVLSHVHGRWRGEAKVSVDDGGADWMQWDAAAGESFRSLTDWQNWGLRLRETVTPWVGGALVLGLDHDLYGGRFVERRQGEDRLATDLEFRNTAPYVMLAHRFGDEIVVRPSVGFRYNDSRFFGDEWGGQAGLKVGFGRHVLYGNAAHSFNLPGVWAAVQYGGWGLGDRWQELRAETVDHVEVGWIVSVNSDLRFDLSVYSDRVSDALRFVAPPPQFANIGDYDVVGVELSVSAHLAAGLTLFGGATLSAAEPADVPNLPETTASVGLAWTSGRGLRLNLDGEYVGDRFVLNPRFATSQAEVDSYILVNGRAAAPFRWFGLHVGGEVFTAVENVFDESYEHRLGYPMPGMTWTVGVDLSF